MGELNAVSACAGLVPVRIGTVTVDEMEVGALTSLSPFGDASAVAAQLKKAHGLAWPAPGETDVKGAAQVIWFGRDEALLMGVAADEELTQVAAVVDQSDAWAAVTVQGAGAVDVLARLVPVDLRDTVFDVGATLRTQVLHMTASITKLERGRFLILVFRSMATTLVHDLKQAMAGVASRG